MSNVIAWLKHGIKAKQAGVALRVVNLALTELMRAQEIFVCNSLIGVWPVVSIGHWKYSIGPMIRQAQRRADEN